MRWKCSFGGPVDSMKISHWKGNRIGGLQKQLRQMRQGITTEIKDCKLNKRMINMFK